MITPDMILKVKKRLERIMNADPYRTVLMQRNKSRRQYIKAALMAKLLNDMEDENENGEHKH
ncbi:hypothetical protein CE91St36_03120 [Christensenellaceae bacterium]|nr:hypothetical protein CE91St36_03120 [Christensenellaceae bacterium]BDF60163.1 hypothetical protein CE91St37_03130 [Christensenellaceae bacterium]